MVWVNAREVIALAKSMELDEQTFRRKFVRNVGTRFSLVEYPDGDCIFLDPETRGCLVYEVRPIQCRTWPFWNSNVKSPQAWEETCRVCPGAGKGRLYSIEQIDSARQQKSL